MGEWVLISEGPYYAEYDLEAGFISWLLSREDLEGYLEAGRAYPVYIATAEGGGLYAAVNSAVFFARMQDMCPGFAQHLFAISSVSGGSLGSAVFSGLASGMAENSDNTRCENLNGREGRYEKLVRAYFADDFLSPLIFGFLFPDFLQRFLPWPIESLDRARNLESSFEEAWRKLNVSNKDYFAKGIQQQWAPEGAAPALLMNTTVVSTGEQAVISPWRELSLTGVFGISHFADDGLDFPVVSAVSASARFPYVTPVARMPQHEMNAGDTSFVRLADGGFFENSGAETAVAVIKSLNGLQASTGDDLPLAFLTVAQVEMEKVGVFGEEAEIEREALKIFARFKSIRFQVISVSILSEEVFKGYSERSGLSEYLSPIDTLMNSRNARGVKAFITLSDTVCLECRFKELSIYDERSHQVSMNATDYKLPLGWVLSARTRAYIASQAPTNDHCDPSATEGNLGFTVSLLKTNRCVYEAIRRRLELPSTTGH